MTLSPQIGSAKREDRLRFAFGRNWQRFLRQIDESRIAVAESSLTMAVGAIADRDFLDVGSGSGLFSMAAVRLGARVTSFDYDAESVNCTVELRRRFGDDGSRWRVERGSILDEEYLRRLGSFDIVYSWGVLHHTGDIWRGVANAARLVRPGGRLFIALYNDQGWISDYWKLVKRFYNRLPFARWLVVAVHLPYFALARMFGNVCHAIAGTPRPSRGMSFYTDVLDWLGGYPFEVASVNEVIVRLHALGFEAVWTRTVGRRQGCNEFVFVRAPALAAQESARE